MNDSSIHHERSIQPSSVEVHVPFGSFSSEYLCLVGKTNHNTNNGGEGGGRGGRGGRGGDINSEGGDINSEGGRFSSPNKHPRKIILLSRLSLRCVYIHISIYGYMSNSWTNSSVHLVSIYNMADYQLNAKKVGGENNPHSRNC